MPEFQPKKLKKLLTNVVKYILVGIAYYIFIRLTNIKIPCLSYTILKFNCPGCGVTRMCLALIEGNFRLAFRQNALIFCFLPFIFVWSVYRAYRYVFNFSPDYAWWEKIFLVIFAITSIVFAILRNLSSFAFLAPIPV